MPKTIVLTGHAQQRMLMRGVYERWAAEAALTPEWSEPEPRHASAERRFRAIPDFGGRVLRVVLRRDGRNHSSYNGDLG